MTSTRPFVSLRTASHRSRIATLSGCSGGWFVPAFPVTVAALAGERTMPIDANAAADDVMNAARDDFMRFLLDVRDED